MTNTCWKHHTQGMGKHDGQKESWEKKREKINVGVYYNNLLPIRNCVKGQKYLKYL